MRSIEALIAAMSSWSSPDRFHLGLEAWGVWSLAEGMVSGGRAREVAFKSDATSVVFVVM